MKIYLNIPVPHGYGTAVMNTVPPRMGLYILVVSADAKPEMYNPTKDAESLVLDAVNIGLQVMHKAPEDELKSMVLSFINSYGFLGF